MNKMMRTLTMAGLGLLAGASAAAPALAVEGTAASAQKPSTSQVQQDFGRDRVAGFYPTYRSCERAGRFGDWTDRWDRYNCYPVRFGFKRGTWVLKVQRDRFGHFRGHDRNDFRGHDGHDFRGQDRHGFGHR